MVVVLGAIVFNPALRSAYILDDYIHEAMISGHFPGNRASFDLYDFIDDANRQALLERGLIPWWSDTRLVVRFFRPLSSVLLYADRKLLGHHVLLFHLHSFLWWIAAVFAVRALLRRLVAKRAADIATLIFALAPCHALPLAWLANREALISLVFAALALRSLLMFRDEGGASRALTATLLFSLSLAAGEYALGFAGYALAACVLARGRDVKRRALGPLTYALPAAIYLTVRSMLDYGTRASGFYADPLAEPMAYLHHAPRRIVTLLADAWASLDQDTLPSSTPWWLLAIFVLIAAPPIAITVRAALLRRDAKEREAIVMLLVGATLAIPPILAVVASPRVLGAAMIAVAATVGVVLDEAWFAAASTMEAATEPSNPALRLPPLPKRGGGPGGSGGSLPLSLARDRGPGGWVADLRSTTAIALAFAHLVHAPMTSWLIARDFRDTAVQFSASGAALGERIGDVSKSEVGVLRGGGGSFFLPFALDPDAVPPARFHILAQTGHVLVVRRGPRTLDVITSVERAVFPTGQGNLFRNEEAKMHVGDRFSYAGLTATVLELGKGGPRAVRIDLDRDVDDEGVTWVSETYEGTVVVAPPAIGFGTPLDP